MTGYDGFSMSNSARRARQDGLVPAGKIKGVPADLVRRFCRYAEWHHTSCRYNSTEFYDPDYVRDIFGLGDPDDADPAAVEALREWKANRGRVVVYENCEVRWLEWYGTRKHPHANECSATGCRVEVKGKTATITLPDGKNFRKRLDTRGFVFKTQNNITVCDSAVEHK